MKKEKVNEETEKKVVENIEKEIKSKKKLPKEEAAKINKKVFENIGIAIVIMLYFIFMNLGFINIERNVYYTDLKVFSGTLLVIAILLFERAYKKENSNLCIHGIEALLLGLVTMFLVYACITTPLPYVYIVLSFSYIFSAYFIAKAIIIYVRMKKQYIASLSDIKEIVKKEKPSKKEPKKKNEKEEKIEKIENIKIKGELKEEKPKIKEIDEKEVAKKNTTKKKSPAKKSTPTTAKKKTTKTEEKNNTVKTTRKRKATSTKETTKLKEEKEPVKKVANKKTTAKTASKKTAEEEKKEAKKTTTKTTSKTGTTNKKITGAKQSAPKKTTKKSTKKKVEKTSEEEKKND